MLASPLLASRAPPDTADAPDLAHFFRAFLRDEAEASASLRERERSWRDGYATGLLEQLRVEKSGGARCSNVGYGPCPTVRIHATPNSRRSSTAILTRSCAASLPPGVKSAIRLDQVQRGGVQGNGIPSLVNPKTIPAAEASYLSGSNVVFVIEIDGHARAYPKRILAWHEMARHSIAESGLAIVDCTLCGAVIPYRAAAAGPTFTLGASGFLYQSSKLMFDEETMSLWSTLQGKPVIGPLTGSGVEFAFVPVVTTTWRDWRGAHLGHHRSFARHRPSA
ncbi:MAG: DUF3179 domain-containing (seleno)protein [Bryobacteraceae bacterium]